MLWQVRLATAALGLLLPLCAVAQEGQFSSSSVAMGFGSPAALVVADFDNDGVLDAATTNISHSSVTIWQGLPALPEFGIPPEFSELPADIPIGGSPSGILVTNMDGDKIPDLVVANATGDTVVVLKGTGDLTADPPFELVTTVDVGKRPSGLAIGDFNGDHVDDIVVANEGPDGGTGTVNVLFGDGAGGLTNCCPFPDTCPIVAANCPTVCVEGLEPLCAPLATQFDTSKVAVGLLNNDSFPDIVALNTRSNLISVFFGDGTGRFRSGGTLTTGYEPHDLKLADLNNDGALDIVTTQITTTGDPTPDSVAVFLGHTVAGHGDGTFGPKATYPTGNDPRGLAIADVNGNDEIPDIVVTNNRSVDVSVLLGDGTGKFLPGRRYVADSQPIDVALVKFDENDTLDIVTANVSGFEGTLSTIFNMDNHGFAAVEDVATLNTPTAAAVGDIDNDGLPDIVVAGSDGNMVTLSALRGGGFNTPRVFSLGTPTVQAFGIAVADLNRDGFLDVAFTNKNLGRVGVMLGRRNGAFGLPTFFDTAPAPVAITVGDFDGDGRLDLAATNDIKPLGQVSTLLGKGDGTFQAFTAVGVDAAPNYIVAADFDGDGRDDLAVLNGGGDDVNTGRTISLIISGSGTVQSLPTTAQFPAGLAAGFLSTDDKIDLIFGTDRLAGTEPTLNLWINNGDEPPTFRSKGVRAGASAVGLALRDFDGDLLQDLITASFSAGENAAYFLINSGMDNTPLTTPPGNNKFSVSLMPQQALAADFDGDGCYDAATLNTANTSQNVSILTNICTLPIPRGDANGDGRVTAADVVAVALEVMDGDGQAIERIGGGSYQAQPTVDNNGDGNMDTKDVIGVDANGDGLVNAQDASAAGRLIFRGQT